MNVTYWTSFSKRKNSTKQPTGGSVVTAVLKEKTGLNNPVFIFQSVPDSVKYIQAFGRYYFVGEVSHDGGEVVVSCSSDPMATFKAAIGSTYADVEYTSSSTNTDITDPRNNPTNYLLESVTNLGALSGFNESYSAYVLGICSEQGVHYYGMNETNLDAFCGNLFAKDPISMTYNQMFDTKSILVSCIKMPRMAYSGTDSISVASGDWVLGNGHKFTSAQRLVNIYDGVQAITFPSDSYGYDFSYLDCAPYSTGLLFLPFVGVVPLDVDSIAQNKSIYIKSDLDLFTGDIVYKIGRNSSSIIATYTGNCASNVPIAGQSYNALGVGAGALTAIGGAAGLIGGLATGNAAAVLGGVGGIAGGAMQTAQAVQHHTQINGSISSFVGVKLGLNIVATVLTRRPAETAIDTAYKQVSGMPYYKGATISSLSGYVKCNGASVDISGFDSDRDTINAYLNSGFYYE